MNLQHKIGEGLERTVWLHPERNDRVVKIRKPSAVFDRNRSDWELFLEKRTVAADHIAVHFGFEETSLGSGLVCEFVQDEGGLPSKSVKACLRLGELSVEEARIRLLDLYDWTISNEIPICDSNLGNILYQRRGGRRLVIVDGFGFSHGLYWRIVKKFTPLIYYNNLRKRRRSLRYLAKVARESN